MKTSATAQTTSHSGSRRRLKLWILFVVLFMGWALYTMVNQMERQGNTEQRLLAAEQKLKTGEQVSGELQQKIDRLNDAEFIQEIARKEYGMIMPGEKPIQITRPNE
ncbi:FtsB family cell division protein [Paenibacillus abyssi]|uniref:Septum formation initiator n=1 Tax=Paenibacillus abyssi TaxID=1340531 RepID=A0A917G6V2_9BACL|nr:septum formation initiator family protein [Paenibacillus abyssi]GGG24795.1 hypothetical protein GCM10010916_46600 [Paenibacillus abyssi]